MNALSVGHMAAQALPSLSPWIIPVIAMAAKGTCDRSRRTLLGPPAKRLHEAASAKREPPAPSRLVTRERLGARPDATSWPD
jgi:hypothetical protein